jgi:hypothetical protein
VNPLTGSTNYLSAYTPDGRLKRAVEADPKPTENKENKKLIPETPRDLRVFPANPAFVSQSVLDDDFREAIWKKIMTEGKSVREISAEMRVEMSRVGAVVRLKEIEKEWQRIVSSTLTFFLLFPRLL